MSSPQTAPATAHGVDWVFSNRLMDSTRQARSNSTLRSGKISPLKLIRMLGVSRATSARDTRAPMLTRLIHQAGRERRYSWRWGGGEFGGGVCIAAGSDRLVGAGGWREGSWTGRQRPRGLWPGGHQGRRDVAEERRLWASRRKGDADAGGGRDDAGADL